MLKRQTETPGEKAKHSLLAAWNSVNLQSLHVSRSSLEALDRVQNAQKFIGICIVTPGQILQQTVNATYLLTILTYLSPGKYFYRLLFRLSCKWYIFFLIYGLLRCRELSFLVPLANPQGISKWGVLYSFVPWEAFSWTSINTRILSIVPIRNYREKRKDPCSKK